MRPTLAHMLSVDRWLAARREQGAREAHERELGRYGWIAVLATLLIIYFTR